MIERVYGHFRNQSSQEAQARLDRERERHEGFDLVSLERTNCPTYEVASLFDRSQASSWSARLVWIAVGAVSRSRNGAAKPLRC
jgi:hypothetical protein